MDYIPTTKSGVGALRGALAAVATEPTKSRGRHHPEAEAGTRSAFQRDRDRIIHSGAFRRLKYKTQVFVYDDGDNFRTRLTHSLEVAQIARSICRFLGMNEDISEALALAHDLGHTCFGHAGEDELKERMKNYDGFDHNAQSLRIVTKLERRYVAFDGLNLTWETLEGLVKHNGPLVGLPSSKPLPLAIVEYDKVQDLELNTWPGPEAQVAALADDIAYNSHDIDDGLRAGLFAIEDLYGLPFVGDVFRRTMSKHPDIEQQRVVHESVRTIIGTMVDDVIAETARRFKKLKPKSAAQVRKLGEPLVGFSPVMASHEKALKKFLRANMYDHPKVYRMSSKARRVVGDLFELLFSELKLLPKEWQVGLDGGKNHRSARRVADYIAGMTDRFALDEHTRLFDPLVKP
ncbi:MAG: deoxyguanosinetriphosphate triphosphohydrolase [Alphaproteobacteria bacterium]|nr:deoxyguanosinetriphosphate triphosphohydrolase [Alphaproteobacteria bacterium]